jgi:hypothetical protein
VDLTGEPPLPPGQVERLVAAGRRSVRRHRAGSALAAVLAVLAVVVSVAGLGPLAGDRFAPATPTGQTPSLPDRIAPFSFRTAKASDAPGGRAIMIFQYGNGETININQALALGADADSYRQIDAPLSGGGFRQSLLSPDGTTVVLAESTAATSAFTVVDLVTGKQRAIPSESATWVALLAYSPDGRYVAYSTLPVAPETRGGTEIARESSRSGTLAILDLTTGRSTSLAGVTPVGAAAFAPDSRRLAVQTKLETWIVTVDGQRERQVQMPKGYGILPKVAWSPEGNLLAAVRWGTESWSLLDGTISAVYVRDYQTDPGKVSFVDATGTGGRVPDPVPGLDASSGNPVEFLGWKAADRIVTLSFTEPGAEVGVINEVPLDGSAPTVLSRFDDGRSCELGMQQCHVYEASMATGLLPSLTVRIAAEPDRGPWPVWFRLVIASALIVAGALAWLVVRVVRWRRRRALAAAPAASEP